RPPAPPPPPFPYTTLFRSSPLAIPPARSVHSTRSTGPLKQSQRFYVLIAESDVRLVRYLRANLEEHSYRVQAVGQGVQFLRQLEDRKSTRLNSSHVAISYA